MSKLLFVIILNYNNAADTISCVDCLKSVKEANNTKIDICIVLVDNASDNDCIYKLQHYVQRNPEIVFIQLKKNLGYAGGNNAGIKYAIKNGADYICLLNNDVIVNDSFFRESINILENDKDIFFAGPAILNHNTNIIQYTGGLVNLWFLRNVGIGRGEIYRPVNQFIDCDYVGGACLFFRAQTVMELGYMSEGYFLFWEETEWCMRARKQGKRCVCVLSNYIEHKGSASIGKVYGMEEYYIERNRVIFSRRNDPYFFRRLFALIFLMLKSIIKGVLYDRHYFRYIGFYIDGIRGIDSFRNSRI